MNTPETFILKYTNAVKASAKGTGLFPSVFMAQAMLESGYGNDILPAKYNNFFGIKASADWHGKTVTLRTHKDVALGGEEHSDFRVYPTPFDSFKDRVAFLQKFSRYRMVFAAESPEDQCKALLRAGYTTEPHYADNLIALIKKHDLKMLDK